MNEIMVEYYWSALKDALPTIHMIFKNDIITPEEGNEIIQLRRPLNVALFWEFNATLLMLLLCEAGEQIHREEV